jgi:hypothetical protein
VYARTRQRTRSLAPPSIPIPPMMKSSLLAIGLLTAVALPTHAQRSRCGTPEPDPVLAPLALAPSDCGYLTNTPQPEYEPSCNYDIQVVFHVIQNTSGVGFLSASKIQDQIDILNEDFNAIQGTPGAGGTNGKIRFHLATVDPNGAPTTGITYSNNNSWFQDSGNYWNSLAWDTNRYMNVYTNAVPCCYGYVSNFPSQGIAGQANDRIVLWWEAVGRQATAGWPLNMGRTATHEVGHYLGVYHTFCGGCGSAAQCYSTGDLICDTNPESSATTGCPASKSSCGSSDPTANYMDYTDDPCLTNFTPEQVNRMRCTLLHWRPNVFEINMPVVGSNYCASTINSSGSASTIDATGHASLSLNNLSLRTTGNPAGTIGLFYYGGNQAQVVFGDGFRCVGGATSRLPPPLVTDGSGAAERMLDFTQVPMSAGAGMLTAGSSWNFQFWFRDPSVAGGSGFNLSDGLNVAFCP